MIFFPLSYLRSKGKVAIMYFFNTDCSSILTAVLIVQNQFHKTKTDRNITKKEVFLLKIVFSISPEVWNLWSKDTLVHSWPNLQPTLLFIDIASGDMNLSVFCILCVNLLIPVSFCPDYSPENGTAEKNPPPFPFSRGRSVCLGGFFSKQQPDCCVNIK